MKGSAPVSSGIISSNSVSPHLAICRANMRQKRSPGEGRIRSRFINGIGGGGGKSVFNRSSACALTCLPFDEGADFVRHGGSYFTSGADVVDQSWVVGDQPPKEGRGHAAVFEEKFDLPPDMHIVPPFVCAAVPITRGVRLGENKNRTAGKILFFNRKYPIAFL